MQYLVSYWTKYHRNFLILPLLCSIYHVTSGIVALCRPWYMQTRLWSNDDIAAILRQIYNMIITVAVHKTGWIDIDLLQLLPELCKTLDKPELSSYADPVYQYDYTFACTNVRHLTPVVVWRLTYTRWSNMLELNNLSSSFWKPRDQSQKILWWCYDMPQNTVNQLTSICLIIPPTQRSSGWIHFIFIHFIKQLKVCRM